MAEWATYHLYDNACTARLILYETDGTVMTDDIRLDTDNRMKVSKVIQNL